MAELLNYECPCCGGRIEFNSATQQMKCPYCDTEFAVQDLANYDEVLQQQPPDDMQWEMQAGSEWQEGEQSGMRTYSCQSCGGQITTDATTAASSCPYCDNPIVMTQQLAGDLRPDYVIPFKLDKEAAKEALRNHFKGKKLLPKPFKDENHIDEIKGVYVPVWLFDADATARIRYKAQTERYWEDSHYRYTETSHYALVRGGKIGFQQVPVDGSTKIDDTLLEAIEPFHFKDAVSFQTAYLSGYLADKYDIDAESSIQRANERIRNSTEAAFRRTTSAFMNVQPVETSIQLSDGKTSYALYPVWLLNTTWNGKKYTFAMNGQTGKFVGDLPADKQQGTRWFACIGGIAAVVTLLITYLSWLL